MDLQLAQEYIKIDALESRLGDIEGKAVGADQAAWCVEQRAELERMRAQLAQAEARGGGVEGKVMT
jgi:hypothetical protein